MCSVGGGASVVATPCIQRHWRACCIAIVYLAAFCQKNKTVNWRQCFWLWDSNTSQALARLWCCLQHHSRKKSNNQLAALVVVVLFVTALWTHMERKNNRPVHRWQSSWCIQWHCWPAPCGIATPLFSLCGGLLSPLPPKKKKQSTLLQSSSITFNATFFK